jgi:hypothetical protein
MMATVGPGLNIRRRMMPCMLLIASGARDHLEFAEIPNARMRTPYC